MRGPAGTASAFGDADGLAWPRRARPAPRQVTDARSRRIGARLDPRLNAISQRIDDRARAEADARDAHQAAGGELGPLHGVPS